MPSRDARRGIERGGARRGSRAWIGAALLVGCGVGHGLTGSDPASLSNDASPTAPETNLNTELCPVSDLEGVCGPPGRSFTATVDEGRYPPVVELLHEGVELPGCAPWTAEAVPDESGDLISIHYVPGAASSTDTGQICDCAWRFSYWVALQPGSYVIEALGDEVEVTVP